MDVIRVETTVLGDFRTTRIDHANAGDADDIRRTRLLGRILEHVGQGVTIKEAGNSGISGKVLECVDGFLRFVPAVILEPDQNTVVGNVEGEVGSDRGGDDRTIVEGICHDIMFDAPDRKGETVTLDADFVAARLEGDATA